MKKLLRGKPTAWKMFLMTNMNYEIRFSNQAKKEVKKLTKKQKEKLKDICVTLLNINPFLGKKLRDDLQGNYSIRLNIKDRVLYSVDKKNKIVYVKKVRTHYGD